MHESVKSMQLDEALERLNKAGLICEDVTQSALVENLDSVLMYIFGMEDASMTTAKTPGIIGWTLSDGIHDVYIICEYHVDEDILEVKLNYGDFSDTFKDLTKHVTFDENGNTQIDSELDNWSTEVIDEWTDAFGY